MEICGDCEFTIRWYEELCILDSIPNRVNSDVKDEVWREALEHPHREGPLQILNINHSNKHNIQVSYLIKLFSIHWFMVLHQNRPSLSYPDV